MNSKSESGAFSAVKIVCKSLGIYFYEHNPFFNKLSILLNALLIILQVALALTSFAYFVRDLSDMDDATEVLSIFFPSILHLWQYFILVFSKPQLKTLFNDFEELIDNSTYGELNIL